MTNNNFHEGLTFDDILLLPGYSDFKRQDVDITITLHPKIVLKLPVLSSPMDTVTESAMAIALGKAGGLGIIHRNLSIKTQADEVQKVKQANVLVGAAVGIGSDLEKRINALVTAGIDLVVIDSGHGNTSFMVDVIKHIKTSYSDMVVMAGNIATADGAKHLIDAGTDILRVGMGPGSICTTRIVTGMGVPQLTAIMESVSGVKGSNVTIVADGGIRQMGDIAKALAVGAHAVMLGSRLAGYDESPGEMVQVQGKHYKQYRGMGSVAAMKKGSAERYGQSADTKERKLIPEGVEGLVPYKGPVADYIDQIEGSLKSAFYYIGAKNLTEFHQKAQIMKITQASMTESHPHTIIITDTGSNYNL